MTKLENFGETQDVAVTVLVDNMADMSLKSMDTIKRYRQESGEPLLDEHGLSALIDLKYARVRILWDAGITQVALMENIRRMKIDPTTIDEIALSHGHPDHIKAMTDVIKSRSAIMFESLKNYIDGEWVASQSSEILDVHNPATGEVIAQVSLSTAEEVDHAVASASEAFFGDLHGQGRDAIQFFTDHKVVISRWF